MRGTSWLPPPARSVKIYVDGVLAKTQNKGAFGAVCRNEHGQFLGASTVTVDGITNLEVLEAMDCAEALRLASDLNEANIHISSDCSNVIKKIQGKNSHGAYCMITKEIAARKEEFQEVVFRHERREANGEAHRLAKTTLEVGRHVVVY